MLGAPFNLLLAKSCRLRLRVMADFSCSGIWEIVQEDGKWHHYPLAAEELDLPENLGAGFEDWISNYSQEYFDHEDEKYRGQTYDRSDFIRNFNTQGKALARQLKQHLGENAYIEYIPETETSIGPTEVIA